MLQPTPQPQFRVTAQWTPGLTTTRGYATHAEAVAAAKGIARGDPSRHWNPNGALLLPPVGRGYWVR